jgi:Ni/Co efflux regulator RcnB
MKATAIACAVLAGTFGFSSLASAQDWGHRDGDRRDSARHERRAERHDGDRRATRDHDWNRRAPRNHDRNRTQAWGPAWTSPQAAYHTPEYTYNVAPRYGYDNDRHGRFYRGGYVPRTWLQPSYYVNWQAYPGLYAPPYGYQWVQSGNDFLLVALTTGLIANLLTR